MQNHLLKMILAAEPTLKLFKKLKTLNPTISNRISQIGIQLASKIHIKFSSIWLKIWGSWQQDIKTFFALQ